MKRVGEPEETLAEVLDRGNSADGFSRSEGTNSAVVLADLRVALPPIVFTRELLARTSRLRSQPESAHRFTHNRKTTRRFYD